MTAFHSVSLTFINVSQTHRRGSLEAGSYYGARPEDKSSLDEAAVPFVSAAGCTDTTDMCAQSIAAVFARR